MNTESDIYELKKVLENIGFEVTVKYNLDKVQMKNAFRNFQAKIESYAYDNSPIALFYYSGLGYQVDGNDCFLPIYKDKKSFLKTKNFMNKVEGGLNLFFIDTCRTPYEKSKVRELEIKPKTLLVYATEVGNNAIDSNLFIKKLTNLLSIPNKSVLEIANDLSNYVSKKTAKQQIPSVQVRQIDNIVLNSLIKKQRIKNKSLKNWYKKQHALVIGISKYKNSSIDYLPNALNDANSIAQLLKKQGVNVTILKNREATKDNILKTIKSIKKKLSKNDSVVVYFAGHGKGISLVSHKRVGCIIPYDFDANLKSNDLMDYDSSAISLDSLKKYMYNYSAKHILLMLDSCFSGLTFHSRALKQPKERNVGYYNRLLSTKAINILTAGADEEVDDGIGKHSPFTYYLLKALKDGNIDIKDGDHFATFDELATYVKTKVAKETDGKQTPQYSKNNFDGEFIFKIP